jgi:DNA-binding IclR family transcriptional regulator
MSQAAARALQVLEHVAECGPASLGEIASALELNKSTAHRLLHSLTSTGFVVQDPQTRRYRCTTKVVQLAAHVLRRLEVRDVARPTLEELAASTAETAHVAVLEDHEIVYIDKVEGRQAMQLTSRVGARGTCHSTALGKVLLASQSEVAWQSYIDQRGLAPRTRRTITDAAGFFEELATVRDRGWALDDIENEDGIRCIGAPVHDHTGTVVAAVSLAGWTQSMTQRRAMQLVPELLEATSTISERLGYVDTGEVTESVG